MTATKRLVALLLGFGLSMLHTTSQGEGGGVTEASITEALNSHAEQLMMMPGVVAVGQGECDGQLCIKVFAAVSSPELVAQLPKTIDGIAVALEISGAIKAR